MARTLILTYLFVLFCVACSPDKKEDLLVEQLTNPEYIFDKSEIGKINGIQCNDSVLIVFDYHTGDNFSSFNRNTGKLIKRFGEIGQGPNELPLGCLGHLTDDWFYVHYLSTGYLGVYNADSLLTESKPYPTLLTTFTFPFSGVHLSKVIPLNDQYFFGAGLFSPKFQYMVINKNSLVVDYNVDVYNSEDESMNVYHKMITNEGTLRKHPTENRFVYFVKRSSNIDFVEVAGSKINVIKLVREGNPDLTPKQSGTQAFVVPNSDCSIWYIDMAVSSKYVYALHTEKKITEPYSSDVVLIFDWNGNKIKQIDLSQEAYYITVNEESGKLYAAIKEEDGGWNIATYALNGQK
ncbi:MAG: BF3164 family lipoprotein [Bacteroidales bacterium]